MEVVTVMSEFVDHGTTQREARSFHHAEDAYERDEGICRTCLAPIWNEGGTIGRQHRAGGWSDRNERGGDSLVCFKAIDYRHVPLTGREACIYDMAYMLGVKESADV